MTFLSSKEIESSRLSEAAKEMVAKYELLQVAQKDFEKIRDEVKNLMKNTGKKEDTYTVTVQDFGVFAFDYSHSDYDGATKIVAIRKLNTL